MALICICFDFDSKDCVFTPIYNNPQFVESYNPIEKKYETKYIIGKNRGESKSQKYIHKKKKWVNSFMKSKGLI